MSFAWAKPYEPKTEFGRWFDERLPLPRLVYGAVGGGYPVPRNLNYGWNFGVLAGVFLVIQIITGIVLAMWYFSSRMMCSTELNATSTDEKYHIASTMQMMIWITRKTPAMPPKLQ